MTIPILKDIALTILLILTPIRVKSGSCSSYAGLLLSCCLFKLSKVAIFLSMSNNYMPAVENEKIYVLTQRQKNISSLSRSPNRLSTKLTPVQLIQQIKHQSNTLNSKKRLQCPQDTIFHSRIFSISHNRIATEPQLYQQYNCIKKYGLKGMVYEKQEKTEIQKLFKHQRIRFNPNWKERLLRRKNFGSYGEIFKGQAADHFKNDSFRSSKHKKQDNKIKIQDKTQQDFHINGSMKQKDQRSFIQKIIYSVKNIKTNSQNKSYIRNECFIKKRLMSARVSDINGVSPWALQ